MDETSSKKYSSYRDLKVWQEGVLLFQELYQQIQSISKKSNFSLITSRIEAAAIDFPRIIAMEYSHRFRHDSSTLLFRPALDVLDELYTLVEILEQNQAIKNTSEVKERLISLMKMTAVLSKKIRENGKKNTQD